MTPEEQAREKIDILLGQAGWILQDNDTFNRNAGRGVAVREFQLPNGPCDYLLFVGGKAAGVIEAKKAGHTLSGVSGQSEKYNVKLPEHLARWSEPLPLHYESNGEEHCFTDQRDPKPRARRVFAFHKPETLQNWLEQSDTLRTRLQGMEELEKQGLRDCQTEAIAALEQSLVNDKPRSLIQMATGAGKTFTACTFSYRLAKLAKAKRILFLVDRNNLGDQTKKEFQLYQPTGSGQKFTDTYITQHLKSNKIDPDAKVVITTIQRLYSMLQNKELDVEAEEQSAFETWEDNHTEIPPVKYNPNIPIETFDFIVVDECHRSIYGLWRQVLEYFDAYLIGLTATPSKHTIGYFNQNLVSEYTYDRSVVDGVNVGYETYKIRTKKTEEGGQVDSGFTVPVRDKRTRKIKYQEMDEELKYDAKSLDKSVTVPNQIRTILQCFKDKLFTEMFPERTGEWVPKTLIFAKDDSHAEDIVNIAREVFNEGNEFIQKITYRNTSDKPKNLIKGFRVDPMPRMVVTVDMIATGTDIRPVEILLFMRDVRSESYYEQMRGRGVRSINDVDLKEVTPDAHTKTRFILVDAVGVEESKKSVSRPLERKRTIPFKKLINQIAQGSRAEDTLSSVAGRLAVLEQKLGTDDKARVLDVGGGQSLKEIAGKLLDSIDPDHIEKKSVEEFGEGVTEEQKTKVAETLKEGACAPFDNPDFRNLLILLHTKNEQVIDDISTDKVTTAEFDKQKAEERLASFKEFMEKNKDELTALQIIYNQPYGKQKLTYASIRELITGLQDPPYYLRTADLWQAYKRLNSAKVKGTPVDGLLTEVVSLVRFAIGQDAFLESFSKKVEQRFNLWLGREKKAGREFSDSQLEWLVLVRDHLAANIEITPRNLMEMPVFTDKGGLIQARNLFGAALNEVMDTMTEALVA